MSGKKRIRPRYHATLNYKELKELENTTVGSFLELAEKVILIDKIPFKKATYEGADGTEKNYKVTTGRKNDFLRLIEQRAVIKPIGIKYHIVKVFAEEEQDEIGNIYLQKHIDKIRHS